MSMLSLDLRGVEATHGLPREAPAKGAGISLLLHCVAVSTLLLIPLLQSTIPPEVTRVLSQTKSITVTLPPPVIGANPLDRGSLKPRPNRSAAVVPTTPTSVPSLFPAASDLVDPNPLIDPQWGDEIGDPRATQGACPLGSLCDTAAVPVGDPPKPMVRIGGSIKEPRLKESRMPVYPPLAQAAGVSARVILEAHVGEDGRMREIRIVEGNPLFDEAALAAVRSRRYEPLLLNGVPTDFIITVTISFNARR